MDYPTPTSTTRTQDRAALRRRANAVLLGFMGRSISRADRRLVARAYANGAYRMSQGLKPIQGRYSRHAGRPVVLNEAMLAWIAFGDSVVKPDSKVEAQYEPQAESGRGQAAGDQA